MTVLCVSPHTDDAELGAGGYIARLVEEGASVKVIALSACEESLNGMAHETLRFEAADARWALNVCGDVMSYPVRNFPQYRQSILEELVRMARDVKPDLVLCPSPADRHQDHRQTADECLRAFRCSIWGWVLPHNVTDYHARGFIRLEERHIKKKVEALSKYESQAHRNYMDPIKVIAWARTVGMQAGSDYAESFEILRSIN